MSYTPVAGGTKWRDNVTDIRSNERKLRDALLKLLPHSKSTETAVLIGQMIGWTAENEESCRRLLNDFRDD